MHAHMHVMPSFRQEPYAGRGIRYWLKQPANRWWSCLVALLFLCAQGLSQAGRYVRADFCDLTPSASGTGYASTFARAGFRTVARRVPPRPIMRHDLEMVNLRG